MGAGQIGYWFPLVPGRPAARSAQHDLPDQVTGQRSASTVPGTPSTSAEDCAPASARRRAPAWSASCSRLLSSDQTDQPRRKVINDKHHASSLPATARSTASFSRPVFRANSSEWLEARWRRVEHRRLVRFAVAGARQHHPDIDIRWQRRLCLRSIRRARGGTPARS